MASDIKIKGLVDQEKTDDITRKVLIWPYRPGAHAARETRRHGAVCHPKRHHPALYHRRL